MLGTFVDNSSLCRTLPGPQVVPALPLASFAFVCKIVSVLESWSDAIRKDADRFDFESSYSLQ
jgi:hypothetical protein